MEQAFDALFINCRERLFSERERGVGYYRKARLSVALCTAPINGTLPGGDPPKARNVRTPTSTQKHTSGRKFLWERALEDNLPKIPGSAISNCDYN